MKTEKTLYKSIVSNPKIQFGEPTIKGTRIFPEAIYNCYVDDDSKEMIAEMYDITLGNVNDAIEFCEAKKKAPEEKIKEKIVLQMKGLPKAMQDNIVKELLKITPNVKVKK